MEYSGSYPVSKLTINDRRFRGVKLALFAFSALKPRDSKTSATPAIAFTLRIENPTKHSAQVSFMFNLPLGIQPDTARLGEPSAIFTDSSLNATTCSEICDADQECMSWQMVPSNKTCLLFNDVPLHVWCPGVTSGQKGTWTAHGSMLTFNRTGNNPQSGNTTIVIDKKASSSFMVGNSFAEVWKRFDKYGYLVSSSKSFGNGLYGAASVNRDLQIRQRVRVRVRLLRARGLGLSCRKHGRRRRQLATKMFQKLL